jgi:hypothetical protein
MGQLGSSGRLEERWAAGELELPAMPVELKASQWLVVVTGWTGAGKSTIAERLGRELDATVASFDWLMSGLRAVPEVWAHVDCPSSVSVASAGTCCPESLSNSSAGGLHASSTSSPGPSRSASGVSSQRTTEPGSPSSSASAPTSTSTEAVWRAAGERSQAGTSSSGNGSNKVAGCTSRYQSRRW